MPALQGDAAFSQREPGQDDLAPGPVTRRGGPDGQDGALSAATAEQIAALFKVLGDPGRCRLLAALIAAGELCVGELAAGVGMTESNVSHHLRLLRGTGLVRARRAGKLVYYSPGDEHVGRLLTTTREHVEHGRPEEDR